MDRLHACLSNKQVNVNLEAFRRYKTVTFLITRTAQPCPQTRMRSSGAVAGPEDSVVVMAVSEKRASLTQGIHGVKRCRKEK
jgi:hypothetical protein